MNFKRRVIRLGGPKVYLQVIHDHSQGGHGPPTPPPLAPLLYKYIYIYI